MGALYFKIWLRHIVKAKSDPQFYREKPYWIPPIFKKSMGACYCHLPDIWWVLAGTEWRELCFTSHIPFLPRSMYLSSWRPLQEHKISSPKLRYMPEKSKMLSNKRDMWVLLGKSALLMFVGVPHYQSQKILMRFTPLTPRAGKGGRQNCLGQGSYQTALQNWQNSHQPSRKLWAQCSSGTPMLEESDQALVLTLVSLGLGTVFMPLTLELWQAWMELKFSHTPPR